MTEPRHRGVGASLNRIRLVAGHTLGEALRMRLVLLFAVAAVLLLLGARWLAEFHFGAPELKLIGDFGLGTMGLLGTLLAALATAQLFFNDVANGAAACVLTRPVRRWEYVAGKLAGVAALLALFTAVLGGLLAGLLLWRSGQLGVASAGLPVLLSACALQWMKFTVIAAMTLLVCTYAGTALFASCAGLLLAVIGHLRPFATGGGLGWLRVWPNLARFDAEALLASGLPLPAQQLLGLAVYWAVCVLLSGVLASYAFKQREF
ncbi:MAG: ABC transporter permease subunit [Opitutae bacterium]|nr:ABC transporter permease subunit [Opitutae bacterium]